MPQRNRILQIILAGVISAVAVSAFADGVDLGDTRMNASLTLGAGYDSNVFRQDTDDQTLDAPAMQIIPALRLSTPNPRGVDFNLKSSLTWTQYLSSDENVTDQSGPALTLSTDARINPRGDFSLLLEDTLRRTNDPAFIVTGETEHVLINQAGIGLGFHPGGHQLSSRMGLSGNLGFTHQLWRHEVVDDSDRQQYGIDADFSYHFLPMTALVFQGSVNRIEYDSPTREIMRENGAPVADDAIVNDDSMPIRGRMGLNGLISRRLTMRVLGGYGLTNYDTPANDSDTWLATFGLGYLINSRDKLDLAYQHDFYDTTLGTPSSSHRVTGTVEHNTSTYELKASLFAQLSHMAAPPDSYSDPDSQQLGTKLQLNLPVTDWAFVGANYNLAANFTDATIRTDVPQIGTEAYVQHAVYLTLQFRY